MAEIQIVRGCLAFAPGAREEALARLREEGIEASVLEVIEEARLGEELLVLAIEGSFPSSYWHSFASALAELSAAAEAGQVFGLYLGPGEDHIAYLAGGTPAPPPEVESRERWFLPAAAVTFRARFRDQDPRPLVILPHEAAEGVFSLRVDGLEDDYNDLLGLMYLAAEGPLLYELISPTPTRDRALYRVALDLRAPERPRLVHAPDQEHMRVWTLLDRGPREVARRRFEEVVEVRLDDHFVSLEAADYRDRAKRERAMAPRSTTLIFARGHGLIRIEAPHATLELPPPAEPEPAVKPTPAVKPEPAVKSEPAPLPRVRPPRPEPPRQLSNAGAAAFFVAIVLGFFLLRWLAS